MSIINGLLGGGATKQDEINRYVGYFGLSNYQKVLGNRPLVYLFDPATNAGSLGGWTAANQFFQDMKVESISRGYGEPYYVVMGNGTEKTALGFDAISNYAFSNGSETGKPYSQFKTENINYWNNRKLDTIIPLVSAGWDKRTRCMNPVPWEPYCNNSYVQNPTSQELANHLQDAINFIENNPAYTTSKAILLYAWNEFDEGGWITPQLYDHTDRRIDKIAAVLKGAYRSSKDWNFNTNGNFENWNMYYQVTGTVSDGNLTLTSNGTDPQVKSPDQLGISDPTTYNKIRIRMKNSTSQTAARVFFTTVADPVWNISKSIMFPISANSSYNNYVIDMSLNSSWSGTIKQIRIDPLDPASGAGSTVDIDYIRITDAGIMSAVADWNFNTTGSLESWSMFHQVSGNVSDGHLTLTSSGTDPQVKSPDNLGITDPQYYSKVKIRLKNNTNQSTGRLFFTTSADTVWNLTKSISYSIIPNSDYTEYTLDMSAHPNWSGNIKQLRLDPLDPSPGTGSMVEIDYIRIVN